MERPSHLQINTHASFVRRATLVGAALSLQVAGAWLFTHGLARGVVDIIRDIEVPPIMEVEKPKAPPPLDPVLKHVTLPTVEMPTFNTGKAPPNNGGITVMTPDTPTVTTTATVAAVVRPAVSIANTHTVPPYPPAARRLGVEGTVTLRLAISAEGRVSAADVVTSAGRAELDEAAQAWIVSHWRYKPAMRDGVPVASQAMASVAFSLKDQP